MNSAERVCSPATGRRSWRQFGFSRWLRGAIACSLTALIVCVCTSVRAQAPSGISDAAAGLPQLERPSARRLPTLGQDPIIADGDGFVLPPVPTPSPRATPLSERLKVFVRELRIEGNTVFPQARLAEIAAPYVGREVSSRELQELRYRLTLLYVNSGYITSGAVIPDQRVENGIITMRIIEGRLIDVEVTGNERLKADYIRKRVLLVAGPPLNINDLQEKLQLLHQDPLIARLNSQLAPGVRLGESVLRVAVQEAQPYRGGLNFDNRRSPSIGSKQVEFEVSHGNITGMGDGFDVRYSKTEGLDDILLGYTIPLGVRGTALRFEYEYSDADVVESPFDDLNIESEAEEFMVGITHPLVRTLNQNYSISLQFERAESKTKLLDRGFSFSPGVKDGKSEVSVLRLVADWLDRRASQVIAIRSTFSMGLSVLGATRNRDDSDLPDAHFLTWLGQFQFARRFGERGNQVIFRTDVQLTKDPLFPLEKLQVGGATTVRGYRENQLVRDNGIVSSVELRFPVLNDDAGISTLQLALFADWGKAWTATGSTPDPKTISSVGVGLRWDPTARIHTELYAARHLRNVDTNGNDLQDDGIHFAINYTLF